MTVNALNQVQWLFISTQARLLFSSFSFLAMLVKISPSAEHDISNSTPTLLRKSIPSPQRLWDVSKQTQKDHDALVSKISVPAQARLTNKV
jgi:hypothetical protein